MRGGTLVGAPVTAVTVSSLCVTTAEAAEENDAAIPSCEPRAISAPDDI